VTHQISPHTYEQLRRLPLLGLKRSEVARILGVSWDTAARHYVSLKRLGVTEDPSPSLVNPLKRAREGVGLRRQDAAAMLGVSDSVLHRWETFMKGVPLEALRRMTVIYQTDASTLIGLSVRICTDGIV
jgi:DNA-binding transcriptional regulator YiaG